MGVLDKLMFWRDRPEPVDPNYEVAGCFTLPLDETPPLEETQHSPRLADRTEAAESD